MSFGEKCYQWKADTHYYHRKDASAIVGPDIYQQELTTKKCGCPAGPVHIFLHHLTPADFFEALLVFFPETFVTRQNAAKIKGKNLGINP